MSSTDSSVTFFFSRTGMRTLLSEDGTLRNEINQQRTWIFPPAAPLDEADDEEDENDQGNGAHSPDEPSLSGDVHLILSVNWKTTHKDIHKTCVTKNAPSIWIPGRHQWSYFLSCNAETPLCTTPLFPSRFGPPQRICIEYSGQIAEWRNWSRLEGNPQRAVLLLCWRSL